MKKISTKAKIILAFMSLSCVFYPILSYIKVSNYLTYFNIGYWAILSVIACICLGYAKIRNYLKKDTIQLVIIYTILYLLLTYIFGLITGFANTPFSLKVSILLRNLAPFLIYLISREVLRYIMLSKANGNKKYIVFITLIYIIMDIVTTTSIYDFGNIEDIFLFVGVSVIGGIFKNILLTYMSLNVGEMPNIIYIIIMEGYVYLVPFIPNLGSYFESVLSIVFPIILLLHLSKIYEKEKKVYLKKNKYKKICAIPIILFLVLIVFLISGIFKYQIFAIASNSMQPTFSRGDAVIIEKYDKSYEIEKGDIISFYKDNKILVHRVEKISEYSNKLYFVTKGDNNSTVDDGEITEEDIVGVVHFTVPIVGYPTVWFSELIK